jgi:hypothetical protein
MHSTGMPSDTTEKGQRGTGIIIESHIIIIIWSLHSLQKINGMCDDSQNTLLLHEIIVNVKVFIK